MSNKLYLLTYASGVNIGNGETTDWVSGRVSIFNKIEDAEKFIDISRKDIVGQIVVVNPELFEITGTLINDFGIHKKKD